MYKIITCPEIKDAYSMISKCIVDKLRSDLENYDRVVFIVSGGNTPKYILPLIAISGLDFSRIYIVSSDERIVSISSPDSTEGMVCSIFKKENKNINYISPKDYTSPELALNHWMDGLNQISNLYISTGLLGVGSDGHFASFFPGRDEVESNKNAMVVPETPPHKYARLTLGIRYILQADLLLLPVLDNCKWDIVKEGIGGKDYPITKLLNQNQTLLNLYNLST